MRKFAIHESVLVRFKGIVNRAEFNFCGLRDAELCTNSPDGLRDAEVCTNSPDGLRDAEVCTNRPDA
jgi:hypothetical protein